MPTDKARRLADALRDKFYIVALRGNVVTFDVDADATEDYIRTIIEATVEGYDVEFDLERHGATDDQNDRWKLTVE